MVERDLITIFYTLLVKWLEVIFKIMLINRPDSLKNLILICNALENLMYSERYDDLVIKN